MRKTHVIDGQSLPEPLDVLGERVTVFGADDDSKPFEVHLQEGQRGGGPPPHRHPWDEAFYVLEGRVRVQVAGETSDVGPGAFVHVPSNTVHAYENLSDTARIMAVVSDCRGGQVFRQIDRVRSEGLPRALEVSEGFGVEWFLPEARK